MNESTTITIDNIVKLIEGIAEAEYQRGYATGLEEKRLTEKHWGRKTGAWIGIDEEPHEDWECDKCGCVICADEDIPEKYHFCPNCGADMREDKTE